MDHGRYACVHQLGTGSLHNSTPDVGFGFRTPWPPSLSASSRLLRHPCGTTVVGIRDHPFSLSSFFLCFAARQVLPPSAGIPKILTIHCPLFIRSSSLFSQESHRLSYPFRAKWSISPRSPVSIHPTVCASVPRNKIKKNHERKRIVAAVRLRTSSCGRKYIDVALISRTHPSTGWTPHNRLGYAFARPPDVGCALIHSANNSTRLSSTAPGNVRLG